MPLVTTPTRLPREVSSRPARVVDDRQTGFGDARRIGEREVALVALSQIGHDVHLPRSFIFLVGGNDADSAGGADQPHVQRILYRS